MFRGMLAIPYLRNSPVQGQSVVSMRFRCIREDCPHSDHGKYMSMPGADIRLFNTLPLQSSRETVGICEGEIDAITATLSGLPSVGVSGVESWKTHFREPFLGFRKVFILADGDEPGMRFATKIANLLPNAKIIPSAPGDDVNSEVLKHGPKALLEKVRT